MLTCGSLFSGIGLLDYGLTLAGFEHTWLCEADEWRRGILARRWPGVPIYKDVRDIGRDQAAADAAGGPPRLGSADRAQGLAAEPHGDGRVAAVDLIAGGFPCKGASTAGKRTGFDHPETVLWREMARAVRELRPRYVLVENVAAILALHDGSVWGEVLGSLAASGYSVVWDCLPAGAVGAPHLRDRVFAVATHTDGARRERDGDQRRQQNGRAHALGSADGTLAHSERNTVRQQPEPERRRSSAPIARGSSATAQDADRGTAQPARREWRGEPQGTPLAVDWSDYGPAVRRWEQVLGRRTGEPLLQGVDARGARRMVRSRLSALGDGVQVQIGWIVGEYIAGLEQERLREAA